MRVKTPSVTTSIRVFGPDFETIRARNPIRSPTASDKVCAMRSAAARAAMRRGSSTRIFRPGSQLSSINASGTRVVLPAPGGATRTADARAAKAVRNSSRMTSIGSGVANLMAFVSSGQVGFASTICVDHLACGITRKKGEVWIAEVFGIHAKAWGISWEQFHEQVAGRTHAQRLTTLAEMANLAVFMASDEAR
jgi:hypothetical protein